MEKDILSDISKKPEKLASAVYLITSFFNDLEPLKWRLRTLASDLVSESLLLKDNNIGLRTVLLEMRSHLSIARNAGLVSEVNHGLLETEFSKVLEVLEPPVLSQEFFRVPHRMEPRAVLPEPSHVIKDKIPETPRKSEYLPPVEKKSLKEFGAVSVKKNSRQSVIISLLKRKKEIMIKDVSPLIEGCSEKTIQRELLAMVKAGILEKHGEKRWSRYTLANEAK